MADPTAPLAELLAKAGEGDFPRAVAQSVVQLLMEADVEESQGAAEAEADIAAPEAAELARQSRPARSRRPSLPDDLPVDRILSPAPWVISGPRFVDSLDRGSATLIASLLPIIRTCPQ